MPAIFLSKDGTLVEANPASAAPESVRLLPGAAEGLAMLYEAGFRLFVVAHQPGVARGLFSESALEAVWWRLDELARRSGARFSGFYHCPHDPDGRERAYALRCRCRKPEPGLIERACRENGLDPARSWMVGDGADDVTAGRRAGCRTALIGAGGPLAPGSPEPEVVGADLAAAALGILGWGRA